MSLFVSHFGYQTIAMVHVGDNLLETVGEFHVISALGLVPFAVLGVAEVAVTKSHLVREGVIRGGLKKDNKYCALKM